VKTLPLAQGLGVKRRARPLASPPTAVRAAAARPPCVPRAARPPLPPAVRGLHSSTAQLNLSCFGRTSPCPPV